MILYRKRLIGDLYCFLLKKLVRGKFTIYYTNITKLSTSVENFVDNFIFFYLKGCFNMQIDKDELLNQAKELLKDEVTQIAFQTWFSSMEITEMTENNIVLKASSQYGKEMLETRYADLVLNTFKFITNKDWTFSVICDENGKKQRRFGRSKADQRAGIQSYDYGRREECRRKRPDPDGRRDKSSR